MQSKILLFSPTFFKKNMKSFMAVPIVYFVYMLFYMSLQILVELSFISSGVTEDNISYIVYSNVRTWAHPFPIALFACVGAICVYYYLSNTNHTYMIHALPVTRLSLFVTNTVSVLVMLVVPQTVITVISLIQLSAFGQGNMAWMVMYWFFACILMDVFFTGLASLAVMFTGQLITGAFFFAVFNCLYLIVINTIRLASSMTIFGTAAVDLTGGIRWFTPMYMMTESNEMLFFNGTPIVGGDDVYSSMFYEGVLEQSFEAARSAWTVLAIYFGVGLVLLVLAFICYKKRQLEVAKSFLSFKWLGYIFRWGVSFVIAIVFSFVICVTTSGGVDVYGTTKSFLTMLVASIIVGAIVFMIAEFIVKKSVHIYKKNFFIEWGAFVGTMALFLIIMFTAGGSLQNNVPEEKDVISTNFYINGDEGYVYDQGGDGDAIVQSTIEAHKVVVDIIPELKEHDYNFDEKYLEVNIDYTYTSGDTNSKCYRIPTETDNELFNDAIAKIKAIMNKPERLKKSLHIGDDNWTAVYAELETITDTTNEWNYIEYSVDGLIDAYEKDIDAGHVDCMDSSNNYINQLSVYFIDNSANLTERELNRLRASHDIYNYNTHQDMKYFPISKDCTYTIQFLTEEGLINNQNGLRDKYPYDDGYVAEPEAVEY